MAMSVVRIVVDGWTWVRGEADNTDRARWMLTDALREDGWPRARATVTITPGGFVRIPFPQEYVRESGARGWGSDADFGRLIPIADEAVHRIVALKSVMARLRSRTRLLTIGVDLNSTLLKGGPKTHSEMVAVVDTNAGRVVHWTGKSYPADAVQARTLVHAPFGVALVHIAWPPHADSGMPRTQHVQRTGPSQSGSAWDSASTLQRDAEGCETVGANGGAAPPAHDRFTPGVVHRLGRSATNPPVCRRARVRNRVLRRGRGGQPAGAAGGRPGTDCMGPARDGHRGRGALSGAYATIPRARGREHWSRHLLRQFGGGV